MKDELEKEQRCSNVNVLFLKRYKKGSFKDQDNSSGNSSIIRHGSDVFFLLLNYPYKKSNYVSLFISHLTFLSL